MLGSPHSHRWGRSLVGRESRTHFRTHGMYVPSDSFGGVSPEKKASQALEKLFTFISAKVILAQLEGSGRGALASYNQEQYTTLFSHLHDIPLSDPDQWLEQLMRKDKALALRVMEVRAAYSKEDFEWDQLQRLSVEGIKRSNLQLMRKAATASLQATQDNSTQQPEPTSPQQQTKAVDTESTPAQAAVQEQAQQSQSTTTSQQQAGQRNRLQEPAEEEASGTDSSSTSPGTPEAPDAAQQQMEQ